MEKFSRRLKYYGIGFGLGLVFVFFFFKNRGCTWLPENRVKNSIMSRILVVSEKSRKEFTNKGVNPDSIIYVLDDGDVDFGESDKEGDSKTYLISKDGIDYSFYLPYESFISEVYLGSPNKEKLGAGLGDILNVPKDSTFIYIDSSWQKNCKMKELGFENAQEMWDTFQKKAKIDFDKTNFSIRPKPEHQFIVNLDTTHFRLNAIWYKTKINVESIEVPFESNCELK